MANLVFPNGSPILHTYSKYAKQAISTNFISTIAQSNSLQSDINRMKAMERQLYEKYGGASTFEEFRDNIAKLFPPQDREAYARFEAEYLSKELKRFSMTNRQLYEYEEAVQFEFDFSELKKLDKIQLTPDADAVAILPKMNVGEIKALINKTFGRRFHTGSQYTKELDNFLTSLIKSGALQITLGKTSETGDFKREEEYEVYSIPNFPWGLTKDVYEEAKKTKNQAILDEVDRAIQDIYEFILYTIGADASSEMQTAIKHTWRKVYHSGSNPAQFFSGGKTNSFISGVQGAMGEFQTALLFEYLQIKGMANAMSKIKGNTRLEQTLTKEQARTDIEIFEAMGIQVKNFVTIEKEVEGQKRTQFLQDIHTRIHPDKLSQYFPNGIQQDFLGFMANFYFNKDYERQTFNNMIELRYALESWIGSIMNMAIADAVEDTVTFYMIGGKYFVPCSVILEASQQIGIQQSLKIYSAYEGKSDKEFARHDDDADSLYTKYWMRDGDDWTPTDENEATARNLVGSRISIQTQFNFFEEIEKYALW